MKKVDLIYREIARAPLIDILNEKETKEEHVLFFYNVVQLRSGLLLVNLIGNRGKKKKGKGKKRYPCDFPQLLSCLSKMKKKEGERRFRTCVTI